MSSNITVPLDKETRYLLLCSCIIVVEGLYAALEDFVLYGEFSGVIIGSDSLVLYHIFYEDDAIFLGE